MHVGLYLKKARFWLFSLFDPMNRFSLIGCRIPTRRVIAGDMRHAPWRLLIR